MSDAKPVRLPGDLSHLNRLIDAWARSEDAGEGKPVVGGRIRRLVGVLAIAGALDGLKDEAGGERIGYKGGSALELRFGFQARASKDLDAAYRGELQEALSLIRARLEAGWNNFTGVISDEEEVTRAGISPPPMRVKVKLRYRGKPFVTIPFELSAAEATSLDDLERRPSAVSLSPVQIEDPDPITFMPIR